MSDLVCLRTYATRTEAELVQELLGSAGILALVNVADAGGSRPEVAFSTGASLFVSAGQVADAQAILATHETPEDRVPQQARNAKARGCLWPAIAGCLLFVIGGFAADYLAGWVGNVFFAAALVLLVVALIRGSRAA